MPGSGKSITALYLAIYMLEIKVIKKVIYLDMDNGLGTLKNRGIEQILIKYKDRLKYISFAKKAPKDIDPKTLIFSLSAFANESCKDTLIIFDSIRNFISGSMSYDEVVMPTLNVLQNGINMKNLVIEIKRRAKIDEVEICGTNALYKLLKEFENKSFKFVRNNNHNAFIIYPL